jgi:nitrate/nitrite transporter NarK
MSCDEVLTRPWISILNGIFMRSKDHQERKARMQAKAAKTTGVMVVVFIVCWFPLFVVQSLGEALVFRFCRSGWPSPFASVARSNHRPYFVAY